MGTKKSTSSMTEPFYIQRASHWDDLQNIHMRSGLTRITNTRTCKLAAVQAGGEDRQAGRQEGM